MKKTFLPLLMALLMTAPFGAKAQTGVENYVSASGYVLYHAPSYYTANGAYLYDFEEDYQEGRIFGWTLIDADGDGYNWMLPSQGGLGHNGSDGMLVSYSYDNASASPLTPDNFLVSPCVTLPENSVISFYVSALDESYPAEHFAVAVSTTVNDDPTAFTTLQEWTLTAKGQHARQSRNVLGDRQGNWYQFTVDLSSYAGQEVYLAIRHFNVSDQFAICIDDIFIGNDNASASPLVGSQIILDGQTVAQNQRGIRYLLNTAGFADGSNHTTKVKAIYQSGETMESEYAWTYRAPEHFQGSTTGLHAESDGNQVNLSWTLPMMSVPFGVDELYYDFADSTLSDLSLIDANNDGQNFRVYPYGGYNGGIGLRSFSWMSGPGNLNPDNFVVLPQVTASADARITFMACDADMPGIAPDPEHFGVAVSTNGNTNPADFTMIAEWNSTGTYTEYAADLSAYVGQQIYVAIRHFNTTGECYFLCVDNIHVTGIEAQVNRPAIGALVFANGDLIASLEHGETSFTHYVNRYTSDYCVRIIQDGSRETGDYYALAELQCDEAELECVAPKNLAAEFDGQKVVLTWEREIFTDFEDDPQGWTFLDADGDGFVFGIYAAGGMNPDGSVNTSGTNASLASFSYVNDYGALTPDNYAFMPKVKVLPNARMTFYAAGFDPNYPAERFGVAVASSDGLEISTLATWSSSYPYAQYSVDLSAYAGQEVYLGFRHCSTVANYALVIDNITVTNVVWAGTASETARYNIYRSTDGSNYNLIGIADGNSTSYNDNDISSVHFYYQVTAVNTIAGGSCESEPAMAADGIHNFVMVTTDGLNEDETSISVYPNPTNGWVTVEAEGLNRVTVMNALGQVLFAAPTDSDKAVLDLSQYGVGLYMIRIDTENGNSLRRVSVVK